jgi:hypothetical protein
MREYCYRTTTIKCNLLSEEVARLSDWIWLILEALRM